MKVTYHKNAAIPQFGSGVGRSDKLHLTQIIRSLGIESGLIKEMGGDPSNRFEAGFTWETALENAWADRLGQRPGEVEKDGIVGSPDAVQLGSLIHSEDEHLRVGEFKFTWKSCRNFDIGERWYWVTQSCAYCYMLGLERVSFHVFFVNGDYTDRSPQYWMFDIIFTKAELKKNWEKIVNHAKEKGWLK